MITGACLCGAVRYEVEGPVRGLTHCHCSMCRKHHGAPFASFVAARAEHFRWVAGADSIRDFAGPSYVRRHCVTCGSKVPTPMGEMVSIPAGNLLGELGEVGGSHVFAGSRAPWHTIADDLPRHDAAPPGWPPPQPPSPPTPTEAGATPGSCLCGRVSFVVTGAPTRWLQCHCSRCRRGRSAAHGSNAFYPLEQFAWRAGRELVRHYTPPGALRFVLAFCSNCGGGAPVQRDGVPFVLVPAGLLDADPQARPQAHIFVGSKAPWYAIHDSLPQFPELPPAAG